MAGERSALDPPISLFEHAQRLHLLAPDGPLPDGGRPFPNHADYPSVPFRERTPALAGVLREFAGDGAMMAGELHDRCTQLAFDALNVSKVLEDLTLAPSPRLRQTARWLVRNGTDRRAVLLGLGLLRDNAEQGDIPLLTVIGRLCFADSFAVQALVSIPGAEQDLMWLADRSRGHARILAVEALAGRSEPAIRDWVLSTPRQLVSSTLARKLAERHDIAGRLGRPDVDDAVWDQAGNLLLAMTSTHNYDYEIGHYEQAALAYERWVGLAADQTAGLDRAALLLMVAEDIASGPAATVLPAERRGLIDRINRLLSTGPWAEMLQRRASSSDAVEARRAAWAIQAVPVDIPHGRFAIRVVVPDPKPVGFPQVEARIMIGGMPVVAASFSKGPAEPPERLIHNGQLRAGDEPNEVMLAEAYCTKGCCGALYVSIVREGNEVIWKNWRSSMPGDPPPEARFNAADYDREVARAEGDNRWEWPARTVARLVADQFRTDPSILGRWDCRAGWCTAWLKDVDAARLTFSYPADADSATGLPVQFGVVIDVGDQDPRLVADQFIESMRNSDPRSWAEIIGGIKRGAERLGITYRAPTRWNHPGWPR